MRLSPLFASAALGDAHPQDDHGGHAVATGHDDPHGHHGGAPHESPRNMTWVLATLAIGIGGTVLLGVDDIWHAVTGGHLLASLSLERWLEPVLTSSALVESRRVHDDPQWVEWLLMAASVGVAFVGLFAARYLYKDNRREAQNLARKERFKGLWTVVFNKYYVDELYGATVVAGSHSIARALAWFDQHVIDNLVLLVGHLVRFVANIDGAIDKYVVDGAVNALSNAVIALGRNTRRIQTGRIELYLYGALAGALIFVGINYVIR